MFDEDAGRFSVTAENEAGKATCSALLVVVDESAAPPKVASPPFAQVTVAMDLEVILETWFMLYLVYVTHAP